MYMFFLEHDSLTALERCFLNIFMASLNVVMVHIFPINSLNLALQLLEVCPVKIQSDIRRRDPRCIACQSESQHHMVAIAQSRLVVEN